MSETTTETNGHAPEPTIAPPPPPPSKTLLAALVVAQHEANPVTKSARNDYHKYNYASAEAIIQEAGEALSFAGLAAFPVSVERDPTALDHVWKKDDKGEEFIDIPRRVRMTLAVVHCASGEERLFVCSVPVIPEKGRPEDKAEFGARTEMLAYALRDLLLLPRLAEGTPSARNDTGEPPRDNKNPPKGQQQGPKGGAAAAPPSANGSQSTSQTAPVASPSTTQGARSAASPAAATTTDPEHAKILTDIRNCVGNDLKWEDKKAREFLYELFGAGVPSKLSKPQAALALQLMIAASDSEEAYKAALEKARAATPGLFAPAKGAAA